ncbi:MAG TPA: nuclear transport factor 2 family protein [Dehalococcoidia bacterium]|nr:nuclear transport factor 2 family protein [Dehalococcoidia bacterium]
MINAPIETNLEVVGKHIALEATDVEAALDLYTDDIVWESPARQLRFEGKAAVAANYRRMFSSLDFATFELEPIERFATEDRVVDDCRVRFTLTGDGFANAPAKPGDRVELRLVHVFEMRDGKISRESTFEIWRKL